MNPVVVLVLHLAMGVMQGNVVCHASFQGAVPAAICTPTAGHWGVMLQQSAVGSHKARNILQSVNIGIEFHQEDIVGVVVDSATVGLLPTGPRPAF